MSKLVISKLFLYRYRFIIGYIVLGLAFIALIFLLPLISPAGLSDLERQSVVGSYDLHFSSITSGDLVDLPYHILQKLSILLFGLTPYAIKLPSILVGLVLGLLLILLLNRWFKSNVALLASILTVLSTPFLYLAGSGTPLIMLVFWPTLLLWLGSKIQGEKQPKPLWCFVFALALLLAIYTPHLIYLVAFIIFFTLWNPHLRFTVKSLPKIPLIGMGIILLGGLAIWITNIISSSTVALTLFFGENFSISHFFENIKTGFAPFFSWGQPLEGVYLSPLVGLASLALAATGLFSTRRGFFASRNAIASAFIVFSVILAGLTPDSALLLVLPLSILTAHGLRYILEKWYSLFPSNPYARVFAIFPLSILLAVMIIPSLNHFVYGYKYTPAVANEFTTDLSLVRDNLRENSILIVPENTLNRAFYEVYEDRHHAIQLQSSTEKLLKLAVRDDIVTLGHVSDIELPNGYGLQRIITSPNSDNSDRIYIYSYK
ncbi:glycosyltransferase family 39 protein [Candidatus Saccharibacteria bacterium]|nr:glycosyltransferase family 39 protein [Candidatus Saccharibacteria bacterium]MBR6122830.1 glycosyltransferase family 39 protein [Candidatus Saccharibacteria bacterium]